MGNPARGGVARVCLGRGLLVAAENQSGSGNYDRDGGRLFGLVNVTASVKGNRCDRSGNDQPGGDRVGSKAWATHDSSSGVLRTEGIKAIGTSPQKIATLSPVAAPPAIQAVARTAAIAAVVSW